MNQAEMINIPEVYGKLLEKSSEIGFTMPSDVYIGSLLKTLVASKPNGNFLELGTGIGLSLSWMVDGMDATSTLTTLDNDAELVEIAKSYFGGDKRVTISCAEGGSWLEEYKGEKFDLVFADAWPGKYSHLELMLEQLKPGGFYIVDDMKQQPNWPDGHGKKVLELIRYLEGRNDMELTKMDWSTGIVIAVKTIN
ncbi:class I SAM-dependent methyltransferase [Muricauda sp. SCSIO 64092]|uniref:O-methyltransferase n=1 Tax=Allomuricauda sp. SCSIO 64092 TaxID=2908842 RepID=UPI001FF1B8C3|nr:class I SAM-dependent methyltransferase [Muricauda sp. SCSIO 64092]UOY06746.1 class I SAM-dependent methyltransferase [Muricauda sp. SCSIO 64092]